MAVFSEASEPSAPTSAPPLPAPRVRLPPTHIISLSAQNSQVHSIFLVVHYGRLIFHNISLTPSCSKCSSALSTDTRSTGLDRATMCWFDGCERRRTVSHAKIRELRKYDHIESPALSDLRKNKTLRKHLPNLINELRVLQASPVAVQVEKSGIARQKWTSNS